MPLLKDCPDELTNEEWLDVKKALEECAGGNVLTEEEIKAKYGIE